MAKTRSKHQKELYASYKSSKRMESNRKRKLERALKKNPENEQIVQALKNIGYRRKTPTTSHWSHQKIAEVMLNKSFKKASTITIVPCAEKQMFKLKERAHSGGVKVWNS